MGYSYSARCERWVILGALSACTMLGLRCPSWSQQSHERWVPSTAGLSESLFRMPSLSEKQRKLLAFLRERERHGKTVSVQGMADATGWAHGTVSTYVAKGHLDAVLARVGASTFEVRGTLHLSDEELQRALSQRQDVRDLGFFAKHRLTRALLKRSRDNMVLALEIFNRPSVENRLDAFAMLFTTAWDQLLKATIIEREGEAAVFRTPRPGRARETIGVLDVIAAVYDPSSLVRKNLERVIVLRNEATHLLMPELQGILARLFQAGVLNYAAAFLAFAKAPFLPRHAVGLLTLVGDQLPPNVVTLRTAYGRLMGDELHALFESLEDEVASVDDVLYAVPVRLKLGFSSTAKSGDIVLTKGLDVGQAAVVVEKPIDIDRSHPHLEKDVLREVRALLRARLNTDEYAKRIGKELTAYDFRAICAKEGWKSSDRNSFHLKLTKPLVHRYSDEAISAAGDVVLGDENYLSRARSSYRASLEKARTG